MLALGAKLVRVTPAAVPGFTRNSSQCRVTPARYAALRRPRGPGVARTGEALRVWV